MPRIVGVDIPADKRIDVALSYIYGIGRSNAKEILAAAGVSADVKANELTEDEMSKIGNVIEKNFVVEGELRRQIQQNIARLRDIGSYRGMRHRRGLPVRGQRTRTNARTRKGPRKTVAGKKGIKEQR
ncbi:MAG: 30S ribosomal protein S13 [Planctomycetes bacterium]|nr:30S ribosomal protein S13 [Planctomycetota bacterium]